GTNRIQRHRERDPPAQGVPMNRTSDLGLRTSDPPRLYAIDRKNAKKPQVELTIDAKKVSVPEGTTILGACATIGIEIPTLCFLETLHPVNVCRICVVELEGARVLVPSCSRQVEAGMVVKTRSERVDVSRKLVLEMLGSSVDLSTTENVARWMDEYDAKPER